MVELLAQLRVLVPQVCAHDGRGDQVRREDGPPVERVEQPGRDDGEQADEEDLEGDEEQAEAEDDVGIALGGEGERAGEEADREEGGDVQQRVAHDRDRRDLYLRDAARAEEDGGTERGRCEEQLAADQVHGQEPDHDGDRAEQAADQAFAERLVLAYELAPAQPDARSRDVEVAHQRHARDQVAHQHLWPAQRAHDVHARDDHAHVEDQVEQQEAEHEAEQDVWCRARPLERPAGEDADQYEGAEVERGVHEQQAHAHLDGVQAGERARDEQRRVQGSGLQEVDDEEPDGESRRRQEARHCAAGHGRTESLHTCLRLRGPLRVGPGRRPGQSSAPASAATRSRVSLWRR